MLGIIRENICYGLECDVMDDEIEKVVEMVYVFNFIKELLN